MASLIHLQYRPTKTVSSAALTLREGSVRSRATPRRSNPRCIVFRIIDTKTCKVIQKGHKVPEIAEPARIQSEHRGTRRPFVTSAYSSIKTSTRSSAGSGAGVREKPTIRLGEDERPSSRSHWGHKFGRWMPTWKAICLASESFFGGLFVAGVNKLRDIPNNEIRIFCVLCVP